MKDFEQIYDMMKLQGMKLPSEKVFIRIPEAKIILTNALKYFLSIESREMIWLPEYNEITNWLLDNQGRGLFLYGNCGRGKSLLSRYVLPAIILKYCNKVVSVFDIQDMNKDIDLVMSKHIVSLDDIGTEEISVSYGNKRLAFAEIMDSVEKKGKLVIVSTNLSINDITARYGDRILDRIKSTTTRVLFEGNSLRS